MVHLILFTLCEFFCLLCICLFSHHFRIFKFEVSVVHLILFPMRIFLPPVRLYSFPPLPGYLNWRRSVVHLILFPLQIFFSLSCASVFFPTTSRILKFVAFCDTSHIFPPCNNILSLSCVYYFSITSRILKLKAFRNTSHIIPHANF